MIKEYFEIDSDNGIIKGDLRYNKGNKMPLIFFFHGFKSFRNWGFIPYMCDYLANNNYNVINIDYTKNGIVDSDKSIFDPDIFAVQTVSSHYTDVINIYKNVIENRMINNVNLDLYWDGRVYFMGHSMGGALCYLASSVISIDKIVSLAAVSNFDTNTERQKQMWKEKGYTEVRINGTGQILKLNYSYFADKEKNFNKDSILSSIRQYRGKYLVIQAKNDLVAKMEAGNQLYAAGRYNDNKELFVLEGTGHTFSASHPFAGENKYLRSVLEKMLEFLGKDE